MVPRIGSKPDTRRILLGTEGSVRVRQRTLLMGPLSKVGRIANLG